MLARGEGLMEAGHLLPRWLTHLLFGGRFNSSPCGRLLGCVLIFPPGLWPSLQQESKEHQRKSHNAFYGFISKVSECRGWGCSSVSGISAPHAQSLGFDPWHHINRGGRWRQRKESQGHPPLYTKLESSWQYTRPCLKNRTWLLRYFAHQTRTTKSSLQMPGITI